MHKPVYFILRERECVAAHWLFSNRAIDQVIRRILQHIHDNRALAEADVFIAHRRRAIAPSSIAAERTAHQSRVDTRVHALNGHIAAAHRDMKVNKQLRVLWIFDSLQALFSHVPLDGSLYFAAEDITIGIIVACNGLSAFTARYHVPRCDRARVSPASLFLSGAPCPCSVASNARVAVSRNVYVFIASGEQNGAGKGASGKESAPRLHKPLK